MQTINSLLESYGFKLNQDDYENKGLQSLVNLRVPISDLDLSVKSVDRLMCRTAYPIKKDPIYIKSVFLSLLSQYYYTDIEKVGGILLFAPPDFKEVVNELFDPLKDVLSFNIIERKEFQGSYKKNYRLSRQSLSKNGLLRVGGPYFTPSEFSFFTSAPDNFYEIIFNNLKTKSLICGQVTKKEKEFFGNEIENSIFYDEEEAKTFFRKRLDMSTHEFKRKVVNRKTWLDGSFIGISESFLTRNSSSWSSWKSYLVWGMYYQINDLGNLLSPYLIKTGVSPKPLSSLFSKTEENINIKDIYEHSLSKSYLETELDKILK